jgi:hypothetical protein
MQRQANNPIRYIVFGFILQLISAVFLSKLIIIIKNSIGSEIKYPTNEVNFNLTTNNLSPLKKFPFINKTTISDSKPCFHIKGLSEINNEPEEKIQFDDAYIHVMVFLLN